MSATEVRKNAQAGDENGGIVVMPNSDIDRRGE